MRSDDLYSLPANLPAPADDGGCDHLPGLDVPPLDLPSTHGRSVRLGAAPTRWTVVYAYPRTGVPTQDSPPCWDAIPGARGCTPQNCAFRDHYADLQRLGATVYGLSTQSTEYQREMAERLHLPYGGVADWPCDLSCIPVQRRRARGDCLAPRTCRLTTVCTRAPGRPEGHGSRPGACV